MFPLVETIRFENGQLHLLDLHQERFDRSRLELFGTIEPQSLLSLIAIPDSVDPTKVYKVRVLYSNVVETVEWHEYMMKPIRSFRIVTDNDIDYHLKSSERSRIDSLSQQAHDTDSIIIVKNGMITDSAYANILLREQDRWITPSTPLLKGVMREHLLRSGTITEEPITVDQLSRFSDIKLINAMIPMDRFEPVNISIETVK